ncbi:MAG: transporter [Raineya sp.]|nr:transporter [Raineya sp.]MDW8297301.1 transporter [Raineya sp.]
MNELEFEILDQIYFVESFEKIRQAVGIEAETLKQTLKTMIEKGWVKCFLNHFSEVVMDTENFEENYQNYYYLATKEGLLAHNSR